MFPYKATKDVNRTGFAYARFAGAIGPFALTRADAVETAWPSGPLLTGAHWGRLYFMGHQRRECHAE